MRRVTGSRVGASFSLSLMLSLTAVAGLPATSAVAHPDAAAAAAPPGPGVTDESDPSLRRVSGLRATRADRVDLPRPARGATAIRLLGEQLDVAAALNDLTQPELVEMLRLDDSVWLDTEGIVFYKDETAVAPYVDHVSAVAPLDETFMLHSLPGAQRTIYLDFDGGAVSATGWHQTYPTIPNTQPAWDPSGNGPAFDDTERARIQTVWQIVAEDYAPFDINVTTADPGGAAITRSSLADGSYGSRVLITPSLETQNAICPGGCGGVAYFTVFDRVAGAGGDGYGFRQPAWVFPHRLGNSAKNIAEAASHEVGHNLGLDHDGNATTEYDRGHGAWAPIMGVGYDHPVSQWSKGNYAGANNTEDDVAKIKAVAGTRVDEAGPGNVGAPLLPGGTAYVASRTDVDTFLLGTCAGQVTVSASAFDSSANLDIQLTILDSAGQFVASADPASEQVSPSVASGMSASLTRTLASGTYYASIDGAGNGAWSTGYDDYGSLGAYTLSSAGCDGPAPTAATTSTGLSSVVDARSVHLNAAVATASGSPSGTVRFSDGNAVVGTVILAGGAAQLTLSDVLVGDHTYTAEFVSADDLRHAGSSSPALTVTVVATPAPAPAPAPTPAPEPSTVSVGSTTKLVAPSRAKAGSCPVIKVSVLRGSAPATGKVVITFGAKKTKVSLMAGRAQLRLPSLRAGKLTIRSRYLGNAMTTVSSARKTIRATA